MQSRRSAFTLVELLVVVSIISLLISILLPALRNAREQSKAVVCLANLKRLGTGVALYLNYNGDRFPPFRLKHGRPDDPEFYVNYFHREKPRWQWFVDADYVGPVISPIPFRAEIQATGSFGDNSVGAGGESGREMTNDYFVCPSLQGEYARNIRNGAYGYNYQYLGNSRQHTDPSKWDNYPIDSGWIRATGTTVLMADSRGASPRHGKHSYTLDPPRLAVEKNAQRFGPHGPDDADPGVDPTLYGFSPVEMRHSGTGNVIFVDTHAEPARHRQLGYHLDDGGVPVPIDPDAVGNNHSATNRIWTGLGRDDLAGTLRP